MATKIFTVYGRPLIYTAFLLSVLCFAHTLPLINAAAQVEIVSHSSYISYWGYYVIVGEVQNTGDQTVINVEISQTYYNDADAVIGTSSGNSSGVSISMFSLDPGRKSPFGYTCYLEASQVDHYTLAIADFTPYEWTMDRQKLNITSHSSSIVEEELIISGEIERIDGLSVGGGVKVLATCYDEHGTVVEMAVSPHLSWEAGQTGAFEITLDENVPLITSYELTAESSTLSIIPEFNSLFLTLLVLSLISIAFFLSKRKIIQKFTPLPK